MHAVFQVMNGQFSVSMARVRDLTRNTQSAFDPHVDPADAQSYRRSSTAFWRCWFPSCLPVSLCQAWAIDWAPLPKSAPSYKTSGEARSDDEEEVGRGQSAVGRERHAICLLRSALCDLPSALCLCPLPTAYCLLPTAYCLLPTAYCLLPTAYCLLPTAYCPLLPHAFGDGGCIVFDSMRFFAQHFSFVIPAAQEHCVAIVRMS